MTPADAPGPDRLGVDPGEGGAGPDLRPIILVVGVEEGGIGRVQEQLERRHGSDYVVDVEFDPEAARERIVHLAAEGRELALVLAEQWMPGMTGTELLGGVRANFPRARRGLLVAFGAWGDEATADAIHAAMSTGQIDYYVLVPWRSPDELFNRTISEFLHEWARSLETGPREVTVVGPERDTRTHEVRSLLARNGIPYVFACDNTPDGHSALEAAGLDDPDLPVVVFHDGRALVNPSNIQVADAFGLKTAPEDDEYDLVIVGAGPGGLAAAVYAGSEGLRTLAVEREAIGGQAGSSSLIRNYLGFARGITGAELAMRAYQQAWVFGVPFVMMRDVVGLEASNAHHIVTLSGGTQVRTRTVVLATGVSYRRLDVERLEALVGAGVYYGASISEAQGMRGHNAVVVGGGNSAGQAALHLARYADQVIIVVRGGSLAASMSSYLIREIDAAPNVVVRYSTEVVDGGGSGQLEWLVLADRESGERERVPAAGLFVLIGARPHTDWLPQELARDQWGYVMTGADVAQDWPLDERPPLPLETSVPGVFAVGDLRHRSMKRVASAVGDGANVVAQVHELLQAAPARGSAR
jgi:thioredoxin reductase (NADPH)